MYIKVIILQQLVKILKKLVKKYGMQLVLKGLIEVCKLMHTDPKMLQLAADLDVVLQRYKA